MKTISASTTGPTPIFVRWYPTWWPCWRYCSYSLGWLVLGLQVLVMAFILGGSSRIGCSRLNERGGGCAVKAHVKLVATTVTVR